MENKTYFVDYINLFDKVYVITSNDKNEFNFLETFIIDGERKYKIPDTDTTILNRSREEIIDINKNNFIKAFVDYLNENMQKEVYHSKEDIINDINRFKGFINSDLRLKDFLYFGDALEQIKVKNNIDDMVKHFEKKFAKSEEAKQEAKKEAKEYIETNNVSQATLEDGTKIAVSDNKDYNNSATIIQLNKHEELEDVIAETKVNGDYKDTHEVIESMANNSHISATAERPDNIDKNDTLATQIAYHENTYNDGDMIAVVNSTDKNNFADNVLIDRKTGNITEVDTYDDGKLYLNGTNQNNYSTSSDSLSTTTNTNLDITNIDVVDDNNPIPEFEELESLFNNNDSVEWTNRVEYLYETNRDKWTEYMDYHEERQNELSKNNFQKKLGEDPRAAFIDISIIALITSIIGTSTLLAILINLM